MTANDAGRTGDAPPAAHLLGRPSFAGSLAEAATWVRGKRVLVTGAAGSVGTPLARVLCAAEPASLALLDHHEYSLFGLERTLGQGGLPASYELLDVRDARRLSRLVERLRPEVLFHLAAAKHVPYGERFPEGVVESNVLATDSLLDVARRAGVHTLVYPSSDKSVDPPSLYGATKRLCEALVQRHAAHGGRQWVVARFVNIVGTRGSVLETFTQQVLDGRPLTVTDERMTRYWIGMDEALWLLLQAGRAGKAGAVVMPACGEPIPVVETARRLAAWYCPERVPYPFAQVGIRPGERLHEVLLSRTETLELGPAEGVLVVHSRRAAADLETVGQTVAELRRLVKVGHSERIRGLAMHAADQLQ